ncbi:MAG: hypothetical protein AB1305_03785 [Candidatus Hadarchaeota archaeon]
MKSVWCRDVEDVVNVARSQGWLFHYGTRGKHYYYVYAGVENELLCLAVEAKALLKGKYVSIDDDGALQVSEKPIMPVCARIIEAAKDENFEQLLK